LKSSFSRHDVNPEETAMVKRLLSTREMSQEMIEFLLEAASHDEDAQLTWRRVACFFFNHIVTVEYFRNATCPQVTSCLINLMRMLAAHRQVLTDVHNSIAGGFQKLVFVKMLSILLIENPNISLDVSWTGLEQYEVGLLGKNITWNMSIKEKPDSGYFQSQSYYDFYK
jgi:hypothetical protein